MYKRVWTAISLMVVMVLVTGCGTLRVEDTESVVLEGVEPMKPFVKQQMTGTALDSHAGETALATFALG